MGRSVASIDDDRSYLNGLSAHPDRPGDTSNMNPAFASALASAIRQARAAGLNVGVMSGFREPGTIAAQGGRAASYDAGGNSSHSYGLASDISGLDGPNGPKTKQWAAIAAANGLHNPYGVGNKAEFNHWQINALPLEQTPNLLASLKTARATGDWSKVWAAAAPVTSGTMVASNAPVHVPGTAINAASAPVAGALAASPSSPYGNRFLDSLANIESNNQNIPSTVDKDYPGQPGSKSQGYFQIDTPTWLQTAAKAGIDTTKYPNAMSAPPEVQAQVASLIPLSRFGARTQRMLGQKFGTLDKTATIGSLASPYAAATGGEGAVDPSIVAHGGTSPATVPTVTASAAAPAAADQPWYMKLFQPQTDAQGNPVAGGKSPLQQAADALGGKDKGSSLQQFKQAQEDEAPEGTVRNQAGAAPGSRNTSPMGGALLPSVPQTYGQTINSFSAPLTWNSAPPRAPNLPAAGLQGSPGGQIPGMTLTSFQAPQGIGYGVDPNIGYGYG
jgi:hypothetical protein